MIRILKFPGLTSVACLWVFACPLLLPAQIIPGPQPATRDLRGVPEPQPQSQISSTTFPAPVLRPDEQLTTIQLADDYRLELVAADPLIQDPIAITFDPDGRIWVCEMRGFMPDIEGTNEEAPVGVISVLKDTDGDAVMDTSTVFLDGLVLPRGLCWTVDGMLVCEDGHIWLCTDQDGDDRSDRKQLVCTYNPGNLEHSLNGLMPALDNWIYNAKEGIRLRRTGTQWVHEPCASRGQWGITQDNHGYLFYNVNASLIRGDLVPCYSPVALTRNPLVDVPLYEEQIMFPIRPTTGINRGYIDGFLRPDGSLIEANSNCGPVVYRGDNLPPDLLGNVFIPEPTGNLIRRQILTSKEGRLSSRNAYEQHEFLAATDERFRPVNMFNAPDGTLYVVDMYRGIIQHGAFITSYLREEILSRQLDQGIHLGRIWRVAHHSTQPRPQESMSRMKAIELVPYLSHSNGWHRDMAQRLIVQRADASVVNALQAVALGGENALGRLHALWTLEGLGRLDPELLHDLLSDSDEHVRGSAVTLYQRFSAVETLQGLVVEDISQVADDASDLVRIQVVQTLALIDSIAADRIVSSILESFTNNPPLLEGVLSGFAGREVEFLSARLHRAGWQSPVAWQENVLSALAGILWQQRDTLSILRFCHLLSSIPPARSWQQIALLEGLKDPPPPPPRPRFPPPPGTQVAEVMPRDTPSPDGTSPGTAADPSPTTDKAGNSLAHGLSPTVGLPSIAPDSGRRRPLTLRLETPPEGLQELRNSSNPRLAEAANRLADRLAWPGKDGRPLPEKRKLNAHQLELFEIGRKQYTQLCAGCHHVGGYGLAAKGPQLLGSEWLENEQRLIQLVLHGVQGPLRVNGDLYNLDGRLSMPGMSKTLDDQQIAGVLTYVRREFLDDASPVEIDSVSELRRLWQSRVEPWTEQELLESNR